MNRHARAAPGPARPTAMDEFVENDAIAAPSTACGPGRMILVLHHVEERPVAEIARSLGIPVGTAKRHYMHVAHSRRRWRPRHERETLTDPRSPRPSAPTCRSTPSRPAQRVLDEAEATTQLRALPLVPWCCQSGGPSRTPAEPAARCGAAGRAGARERRRSRGCVRLVQRDTRPSSTSSRRPTSRRSSSRATSGCPSCRRSP